MPPKKPLKKRETTIDWDWVGTEVTRPEAITPLHRKRAAGLIGGEACTPRFFPLKSTSHTLDFDDAASATASEASIKFVKQSAGVGDVGCTAKRCRGWHLCLNHLGGEEAVDVDGKAKYIEANVGGVAEGRKGPVGLRNLGATCYANAFLQLWFHNIAFRNGVYESLSAEDSGDTALYHLGLVFASLEKSERPFTNPEGLIDKLKLEKGNQQDAQEFSQLFINMINNEFQQQHNPDVRNLITNLFKGSMRYTTVCETCNYKSERDEEYSELTINLKNNATLEQCLETSMMAERLDGSNKYSCPQCQVPRSALRQTRPMVLPPVLHIALLRFTYDAKDNERKKSSASIKFGKQTILGGTEYELKGIIEHEGPSAHHGHFTCETFDEDSKEWYTFNDELVTKSSKPIKKKTFPDPDEPTTKKQKVEDGESRSSKNAYMLVYQKKGFVQAAREPPEKLLDQVQVDNMVLEGELDKRAHKWHVAEDEYCQVNEAKEDVLKVLPGVDCIVPRDQLSKWLKQTNINDLFFPWDFSEITCEHGGFDPKTLSQTRLISLAAFDRLTQYSTPLPDFQICQVCIDNGFNERTAAIDRDEQIEIFHSVNLGEKVHVMPKRWLKEWIAKKPLIDLGLPTSEEFTLWCCHGNRYDNQKTENITSEALALLHSILGEFKTFTENEGLCCECAEADADGTEQKQKWSAEVKEERKIWRAVNPVPISFDTDYYILPRGFMDQVKRWKEGGGDRAVLGSGLCACGGVDYDPGREGVDYVGEGGWKLIQEKYGEQLPVLIQFTANPSPGIRTGIASIQPKICDDCRITRLKEIAEPIVYIVETKAAPGEAKSGLKRSRGGGKSEWAIMYRKGETVKDIKVEIYNTIKISPISQRLFHKGKELLRNDETLESLGVLHSDELVLVEVKQEGEPVDDRKEGFGGTALMEGMKEEIQGGLKSSSIENKKEPVIERQEAVMMTVLDNSISKCSPGNRLMAACPDCTFVSPAEATMCEVCTWVSYSLGRS